jgi:hypothetical protein
MQPSELTPEDILPTITQRSKKIAAMEEDLQHQREMRAVDARWLVSYTDLSRSVIAALVGVSRVTLNQYLKDGGIDDEYLERLRERQQKKGIVLYSPDVSRYLDTADVE